MTATDELRRLLDERGVKWWPMHNNGYYEDRDTEFVANGKEHTAHEWGDGLAVYNLTPEQAIAATLGGQKAKAHPYGYEPDTGAFDTTRCECGCLNDISAMYCNDCGGEIEIDESAEKEIYEYTKGRVFAVKHDDGSLEFCERRYVPEYAATLGSGECENVAPDYLDFLCSVCGFVHYHSDENDTGDGNDWAYCPRCGKAVKR